MIRSFVFTTALLTLGGGALIAAPSAAQSPGRPTSHATAMPMPAAKFKSSVAKADKIKNAMSAGPALAFAFSPDGKWLASVGGDRAARLWNVKTGKELITMTPHTDQVWSVAFSPDGKLLATAGLDGTIRLFDVPWLAGNLGNP